jgi:hypothetical protein
MWGTAEKNMPVTDLVSSIANTPAKGYTVARRFGKSAFCKDAADLRST